MWSPILDGDVAERALGVVRRIGAESRTPPDDLAGGLYNGVAGLALMHGYLARLDPDRDHDAVACALLEAAVERLGDHIQAGLAWGVAGIAWVTHHLRDLGLEVDESLDEFLADCVEETPWEHPFDLMEGLAGIGLAVVDRAGGDPRCARIAAMVVDRFEEIARPATVGSTFAYLPPQSRGLGIPWSTRIGPSHGVSGVIGVLARFVEVGVERQRARRLLDQAVAWLLDRRLPPDDVAVFPSMVVDGVSTQKGSPGWCHGDPGTATALLGAGQRVGEPGWVAVALDTLRLSAGRDERYRAMQDIGLCHGVLGIAHLFHRAHVASGDERFRELAHRMYVEGVARWQEPTHSSMLLEGRAGIGLALLSGATAIEPAWDEAFQMS